MGFTAGGPTAKIRHACARKFLCRTQALGPVPTPVGSSLRSEPGPRIGPELPALRALFRVFLDLMPFTCVRLKLFVRRDLFRKLTQGGFVNLTHVNARKIEITWDEDDLKNLLCQRVRENREFLAAMALTGTFKLGPDSRCKAISGVSRVPSRTSPLARRTAN